MVNHHVHETKLENIFYLSPIDKRYKVPMLGERFTR
jgi:hypothetical protein